MGNVFKGRATFRYDAGAHAELHRGCYGKIGPRHKRIALSPALRPSARIAASPPENSECEEVLCWL